MLDKKTLERRIITKTIRNVTYERIDITTFADYPLGYITGEYGYDSSMEFYLRVDVLETDEEYDARIAKAKKLDEMSKANKKKDREDRAARDKKEFERLRKKYKW